MQIQKKLFTTITLFSLFSSFGLISCGGGSSNNTTATENPKQVVEPLPTPITIDDINCNVSYPLHISSINDQSTGAAIPVLFDDNKTNTSSWQANTIDSKLLLTLTEPALLKQLIITWKNLDYVHLFDIYGSKDQENWQLLNNKTQSEKGSLLPEVINLEQMSTETVLYIRIELAGNDVAQPSSMLEIEAFGCQQDISHNIELVDWYLSVPTDEDNNGKSDSIKETVLADGYTDPRFFTLSKDGGLVFTTSVSGYRTSANTNYVRSELREMLRRGDTSISTQGVNKNNWVFASAPPSALDSAGGIDGELDVELAVNNVTTTGEAYQIGRVIIGQIHANDDEPARLYYRKLPGNSNGSIYLAHESLGGDDTYYEIIGSRANTASNPADGIKLDERFSYSITVSGNKLTVKVIKADGNVFEQTVDMTASGYDQGNQYMYFKAGVYNQNNSGDNHDFVRATFYKIDNSHSGYSH